MKTCTELQTMAVSYQEICEGQRPWNSLGNFMNDLVANKEKSVSVVSLYK